MRFRPPGNTRWWAKFELYSFLQVKWDKLRDFIVGHDDINVAEEEEKKTNSKRLKRMRSFFTKVDGVYPASYYWLKLELAAVVSTTQPLISTTYNLEGDGPLSLLAYDEIIMCKRWLEGGLEDLDLINLKKLVMKTIKGIKKSLDIAEQGDIDDISFEADTRARAIVQGAWDYFNSTILVELQHDVLLMQACRCFVPLAMRREQTSVQEFNDLLKAFKRYNGESARAKTARQKCRYEWEKYLQVCSDIAVEDNQDAFKVRSEYCMRFWKTRHIEFPALRDVVRLCLTIIPSSGAAERVFSLLKAAFDKAEVTAALEDLTAGTVFEQYNTRPSGEEYQFREEFNYDA